MPNSSSSPADPSSMASATASARPAAAIFEDFIGLSASVVDATGTAGWSYQDGSPWDPEAPSIAFFPTPCPQSNKGRFMQFELVGPIPSNPRESRERMKEYMKSQGYAVTRSIDPPAGVGPKRTYLVSAELPDGSIINYGANDEEQLLDLASECSDHPSLEGEVNARTK
ncbi:hypothetical protein [Arthrobacter sp. zg-Y179]|uniref:hypothetical protein n=1 Tax=Arthrobacter sp. zg-Y179 TaxID=2894188 RepID=UPI001E29722B|nr:hypothetical protein [Arthrobacter sp. zg-Y179]MCC9174450.1 hypothetical protein [Arthrobacter sp. zg-Y179]